MKKLLKKPEALLISLALIFLACAVLAGYLSTYVPKGSTVYYVSEEDKEKLLQESTATSVIVNLNTAKLEELCLLPGIDEVTAGAIIDYRTEKGRFRNTEELKNIKGIGEIKYKNILPYVTIE